jgi:hypothetical protein
VSLALQTNFSTLILAQILVLKEVQTIISSETIFAKPVTPLVRPVLEFLRINVSLVLQRNISFPILVGMLALREVQTTLILIRFAKPVTSLARPVLEYLPINVFLVPLTNIFS